MPGASIDEASLNAFKIGCVVVAWNNYNMNYLNIEYGFFPEAGETPSALPDEGDLVNSIINWLDNSGRPGAATLLFYAWVARSHGDNIAE